MALLVPVQSSSAGARSPTGTPSTGSKVDGEAAAAQGCLAVMLGAAVNQDGRSSSLTAPNGPAQQQVIRQALKAAGVEPGAIAALQMHGTGTPLGDPIEVGAALEALLRPQGAEPPFDTPPFPQQGTILSSSLRLLGSKSTVGHAEPAAGLTALIYAVHQACGRMALPLEHLRTLNPHVAGALQSQQQQQSDTACRRVGAPRQFEPMMAAKPSGYRSAADVGICIGVSAFAFQVNIYSIF